MPIQFSSRLMAMVTLAGVSIGLGNVWRFPYMMGQYGGFAFVLVYIAMLIFIAVPALAIEWRLGQHSDGDAVTAYRTAFGSVGRFIGLFLVLGIAVADSYYMVVIGNIAYTTFFSMKTGFGADGIAAYQAGLASGPTQYGFALLVLGFGLWILHRGLKNGIEWASRAFVPLFGVVVIYLVIQTLMLPGAWGHLAEFLQPDFSLIGAPELFAAMGQACFSVGLGGTLMVVYGSHLSEKTRLLPLAATTAFADLGAALLAALFIVPAVLVFGISMNAGPGLLFATLPELFATMPGGRVAGSAFLLALTLMAFLSALAGLHVLGGALRRLGVRPGVAIAIIAVVEAILMAPSSWSTQVIGLLDLYFGSGMQILGATLAALAVGFGLQRGALEGLGWPQWGMRKLLVAWARWLIPALLAAILVGYIVDQVRS